MKTRQLAFLTHLEYIKKSSHFIASSETKKLISHDCSKERIRVMKHHLGESYINYIIDEMVKDLKELRNAN